MPKNEYDQRLVGIRVDNLRALMKERGLTQSNLASMVGVTQGVVNHYVTGRKPLGRSFCGKVELALGLPQGGMDHINIRTPQGPLPAAYQPVNMASLSSLQRAAVDVFIRAAASGNVTDEYCAEVIARFVPLQVPPASGAASKSDQ